MDSATITYVLFCSSAAVAAVFLALIILLIATSQGLPVIHRTEKEKFFYDPLLKTKVAFPSYRDKSSVDLSVIIPAYNEEQRLPPMLKECMEYLEKRFCSNCKYEVIVVIDGGNDGTADIAYKYSEKYGTDKVRVLDLEFNRGKGGAVRLGMQSARGAMLLFADADGATEFEDVDVLEASLRQLAEGATDPHDSKDISEALAIAIGSRAHMEEAAIATRSFFRTILMHGFHFLVWLFAVRGIKDTQCGFKLFTRRAARMCFESIHVERWAFDVELLYIAQTLNIPISEVGVNWTEIEGSKLVPVWSWIQMGGDLFTIWLRYTIGAWKIRAKLD